MHRQLATVKDPEERAEWQKFLKKKEQAAYEEACMHNIGGVSDLAWIPADLNDPFKKDAEGKLLGKYVFKVRKLDELVNNDYVNCPTFEVHPDAAWVEKNILPEYVATAQKIACDFYERINPEGQRYDEQGYVDVSSLGVKIPLDTDPVNKLRYVPQHENKNGKVTCKEQWFGFCNAKNKKVILDNDYVNNNFSAGLVADVKAIGIKGEKKYIPIPPGDAKPRSSFPEHLQKGPKIKYKQAEDQNTCLVYSFASALHHIGAAQAASELI